MITSTLNPKQNRNPTRGIALVVVLAILVLIMGLCVGFLTRVSTEQTSSGGYASSVNARVLGNTAVQIVQAQINAATTQGINVAWSSQPGLIRTYDNAGAPLKSYKLYSSDTMQSNGALNPATEAAALASWYDNRALFTDLNQPVATGTDSTPDCWPILDPSALGSMQAPLGFGITNAPVGASQGVTNAAPMPVRWLYILKNGQTVAPSGSGTAATITGASRANPIVGRIAFWTDDESCKVNINTASEGTYWDIPRANTGVEKKFGGYQPAKNEFQMFPGHPATTSLSAVFPGLLSDPINQTARDNLFSIVPRLQNQGSQNGTVNVLDIQPVTLDTDRLYSSVDELLFAQTFNSGRIVNTGMDKKTLEGTKFLLTATSRSPETNLFNLPRIACWPVSTGTGANDRSAFDRLIAFCGTLDSKPFFFQRQYPNSPTQDYDSIDRNSTLYGFLQSLTNRPTPGFGGTLATKFGDDNDQILTEIFDYIRCATLDDKNLPNKTGQFAKGIPALPADNHTRLGYGQVTPITIGSTRGAGRFITIPQVGIWMICTGDSTVAESNDPAKNMTLATGTPLVSATSVVTGTTKQIRVEMALLLEPFCTMAGWAAMRPDITITVSGLESWTLKASGDSNPVNLGFPSLGAQTPSNAGLYVLGTAPDQTNKSRDAAGHLGIRWGLDHRALRARNEGRLPKDAGFDSSPDGASGVQLSQQYPFVGEPVTLTLKTNSSNVEFSGGLIKITIANRQTGDVIQTLDVNFPSGSFPSPKLYRSGAGGTVAATDPGRWTFQAGGCGLSTTGRFENSYNGSGVGVYYIFQRDYDVVRSMVAAKGQQTLDYRLIALTGTVPYTWFDKHPSYDNTGIRLANSFEEPGEGLQPHVQINNNNLGKLANISGNYGRNDAPAVPYPALAAQNNCDWENGLASDVDGPYMNKPDEGNTFTTDADASPPYFVSNDAKRTFTATFSSPNRVMPSPGMFGSLPTGVKREQSWQTLLFRRQPGHPDYTASSGGFTQDPDYLLMDLFWMPVVEPYAISEPLSTAGKINMNQQIVPFTYIERKTGLYAVLKNEKVMSIPNEDVGSYKSGSSNNYRRDIKIPETLKQFDFRFENTDNTGLYAFRTPAEICDIHFVPDDLKTISADSKAAMDDSMADYWSNHALTGDNSRERIATTVYPRLTTKSNTYTVHFRAQSLQQVRRTADQDKWFEGRDVVTGEYRGSTTLERFIDPNITGLPDYALNPDATPTLDSYYRWRVRVNKQFAP